MTKIKYIVISAIVALTLSCCSSANTNSSNPTLGVEPPFPKVIKPFGKLTCSPFKGVIFCPGGVTKYYDRRVPSFDKVPLDADLTLPSTNGGPFNLIVMLHGLGGTKTDYEISPNQASPPAGSTTNVGLAKLGFAVLNYTARGFGGSCGNPAFRTKACAKGWQHLADQRYEIHDTQYLAGLLVDEGLVKPTIGVMGISYGAGQSVQLALLKNRIRLVNGDLVPWVSPKYHVPMQVGAAFVMWGWFNLVQALAPEGNFVPLSTVKNKYGGTMIPSNPPFNFGVPIQSWLTLLIDVTHIGYLAPNNTDPTANIVAWGNAVLNDYVTNPELNSIVNELKNYKSGAGIPISSTVPAPIYIANGFTDPLFPASQALELYSYIKTQQPSATIQLFLGDMGHTWADNPSIDSQIYVKAGINFLTQELKGKSFQSSVDVMPVACAGASIQASQLNGPTFNSLNASPLTQTFRLNPATAEITSIDPNQALSNNLNDLNGKFCHNVNFTENLPNAVDLNLTSKVNAGTKILGSPIVTLNFNKITNDGEVVGRLFSIEPHGSAQLITQGAALYSNKQKVLTFALNPTYFQSVKNSKIVLDLSGSDSPSFRSANLSQGFNASINAVTVMIPTAK